MPILNRFMTITNGAAVFIGNTLTCMRALPFPPSTQDYVNGAYISTNPGLVAAPGFPAGTTFTALQASSSSILNMPAGSTVLFAQLYWVVNSFRAGANIPITFTTPSGANTIAPDPVLQQIDGSGLLVWNASDVTALVQQGGAGTYTVSNVPGVQITDQTNFSVGNGWGLMIAYSNPALPVRYININTGTSFVSSAGGPSVFNFTGFSTPPSGPIKAVLFTSELGGDLGDGAQIFVGPTAGTAIQIGNPSNPWNGAAPYAAINDMLPGNVLIADGNSPNLGLLDTTGTFGSFNKDPFAMTAPPFARTNTDIAGFNISNAITNSETTLYTRVGFSGSGSAWVFNQSVQVDANAPLLIPVVKKVNTTTAKVGDVLTYTITSTNSGTAAADNVVLTDSLPAGTTYVPGSVSANVPITGDPTTAVTLTSSLQPGATVTVTYQVTVDVLPTPNPIPNTANIAYSFIPAIGQPPIDVNVDSNTVTTLIFAPSRGVLFI